MRFCVSLALILFLFSCSSETSLEGNADTHAVRPDYGAAGGFTVDYNEITWLDSDHGNRPVTTDTWAPVDVDAPKGIVIVSPGSKAYGELYSYIGEHLAGRGYIVLAVNHFGDGGGYAATDTVYLTRVWDIHVAAKEGKAAWPEAADQGIATVGHSIGGYDALAACGAAVNAEAVAAECDRKRSNYCGLEAEKDSWNAFSVADVDTCIGLTPFNYPIFGESGEGAAKLDRPSMLIGATEDNALPLEPYLRNFHANAPENTPLVVFEGAGHLSFTDLLPDGTLAHDSVKAATLYYVTAWLEATLHGDGFAADEFKPGAPTMAPHGEYVTLELR